MEKIANFSFTGIALTHRNKQSLFRTRGARLHTHSEANSQQNLKILRTAFYPIKKPPSSAHPAQNKKD